MLIILKLVHAPIFGRKLYFVSSFEEWIRQNNFSYYFSIPGWTQLNGKIKPQMFSVKGPSKAEAIVSASWHAVCFLEQVNDALFESILKWLQWCSLYWYFPEYFQGVLCSELPYLGTLHPWYFFHLRWHNLLQASS